MIDWIKFEKDYPDQIDHFYNWLAPFLRRESLTLCGFFKARTWLQIAIFYEYLKDQRVDTVIVNPVNTDDCVDFIEHYLLTQPESQKHQRLWNLTILA